mgnify:CR=1 FL=1
MDLRLRMLVLNERISLMDLYLRMLVHTENSFNLVTKNSAVIAKITIKITKLLRYLQQGAITTYRRYFIFGPFYYITLLKTIVSI